MRLERSLGAGRTVVLLSAAFLLVIAARPAHAAVKTWSDTAPGSQWSDGVNWVGGVAPVAGDDIVFPATATGKPVIQNLGHAFQIASLTFHSTGWTITGQNLQIGAGGLSCTAGTGQIAFSAGFNFGMTLNVSTVAGCTLDFNGGILENLGGPHGLTKTGAGTLVLGIGNSFSGPVNVNGGLLDLQHAQGLGFGDGTAGSGTTVAVGAALRISVAVSSELLTLQGGAGSGSGALFTDSGGQWQGSVVLNGDSTVGANAALSMTGFGASAISGAGGLTKIGGGVLSIGATATTHTFTGPMLVSAGTLRAFGTFAASSTTAQNTATLAGVATLTSGATVNSGGTLSPGASPGIINTGNLLLAAGSTLSAEINGTTPGTQYDRVNVTGTVALGGATLALAVGFAPAPGDTFTIVDNDGADAVTGTFAGLPEGASIVAAGATFVVSYVGGTGNDVVLAAPVGVPALPSLAMTLLAGLLLALSVMQVRRRQSHR